MKTLTNQQGDVLFYKLKELPSYLQLIDREGGKFIFAKGEATGHHHATVDEIEFYQDDNGRLFIKAENQFTVTHQEHKPQTISRGIYEIGIVQEFDYDAQQAKNVID